MAKKTSKKPAQSKRITNKRARFDYELGDTLLAGLELTGAEAKSLRLGHGQLRGAYVTIKDSQLWLLGAAIHGTNGIPINEEAQTRTRRLLAKRKEINALVEAKQQGRTIVPLEILTEGRYIKLCVAIGKGKKNYDKRQAIKQRDETRNIQTVLKSQR